MAADNVQVEWHLTPGGWVKGTARLHGKVDGEVVEPPTDRLVTFEFQIYQRSMWSGEERNWYEVWRSGDLDDERIRLLQERFPIPVRDMLR